MKVQEFKTTQQVAKILRARGHRVTINQMGIFLDRRMITAQDLLALA